VPYKDPVKRKAMSKIYKARWYQKNKELTKAQSRENKRKQKNEWDAYKSAMSCSHCGASHPSGVILDFHHVDRTNKQNVSSLIKDSRFAAAMEEVKKCIPLCANCHRILHWKEAMELKRIKKRKKASKVAIKRA